jgi:hypothetical protein
MTKDFGPSDLPGLDFANVSALIDGIAGVAPRHHRPRIACQELDGPDRLPGGGSSAKKG